MKRCLACDVTFAGEGWRCPACGVEPRLNGCVQFAPELAHEADSFEGSSFAALADVEAGSFWFRARNDLIGWALATYCSGARSFFEVGCGTGFVLAGLRRRFPDLALVGGELFAAGIDVAAGRLPGVELYQMDARRIPYADEFDAAGAFDVLEHVEEDEEVLQELARSVRPGGGVLITVPQHAWLWSPADDFARHRRRYSRGELERKLRSAGLEVVRTTSFVTLLLPLMALSRGWQRAHTHAYDPAGEFTAAGHVTPALQTVMRIEHAAIRRGVSLPAGGSLLAIARRPVSA